MVIFNKGLIDGIEYRHIGMILTSEGTKLRFRMAGVETHFIMIDVSDAIDDTGTVFPSVAAFVAYWNLYYAVPPSDIVKAVNQISGLFGIKIITGAAAHAVNCRGFVARIDATQITAMTINGASATLTDYFPAGTTFYKGELFTFGAGKTVTSITLAALGSLATINIS